MDHRKERGRKAAAAETIWLFGLHAVRDALLNPAREKLRLVVTRNALDRSGRGCGVRRARARNRRSAQVPAPLDPGSVHQGAALETRPLDWGSLEDLALGEGAPRLVLLDRVSDPHNVGAILRSAEVFGARAVVAPARHSAPETGALAKTASGRAGTSALPARAQPRQRDRDAEIHGLPRHRPRRRGAHRHRQGCGRRAWPPGGAGPRGRGAGPARAHARVVRCLGAHSGRGRNSARSTSPTPRR
jgi:tRNA G18 (ribose-2'-O)-methylase SpoU